MASLEVKASGLSCVITENSLQMVLTTPYCRSLFVSVDSKVWVHIALGLLKLAPK